jgi:hypothetical protein
MPPSSPNVVIAVIATISIVINSIAIAINSIAIAIIVAIDITITTRKIVVRELSPLPCIGGGGAITYNRNSKNRRSGIVPLPYVGGGGCNWIRAELYKSLFGNWGPSGGRN